MLSVLITGGGRGIGRAIALAFAESGATIAIAARTFAHLESTAAEIRDRGADAIALSMDVTDASSVRAAFARLTESADRLDVLVNNAGVGGGQPVDGSDEDAWRRIIDTNVTGTYLVSRAAQVLPSP